MRDAIDRPITSFRSDTTTRVHPRTAEVCPLGTSPHAERRRTMVATHARRTPPDTRVQSEATDFRSRHNGSAQIVTLSELPLSDAHVAARVLGPLITRDSIDVFGVACLCRKRRLLAWHQLERRTAIRPLPTAYEALFASALAEGTDGLLVVQAHPDDDPRPNRRDALFTARLAIAAGELNIPLIDHLIVDRRGNRYFSFNEFGLADPTDSYAKGTTGHHAP
jgi:hypothetical protein